MLLLYLTATAAHACVLGAGGPHASAMPEPCCEAPAPTGTAAELDCCQVYYSSPQATPAAAKIAALTTFDLPIAATRLDIPFLTGIAAASPTSPPDRAASPPLRTLYCCLRN